MATSTFTANTPNIYKVNRYPDGEPVGIEYNYKQGLFFNMDLISTGGKKLASVNVADLFEVYPELASEYYVGGWGPEDSNFKEEQDFADNIVKAAQHVRNKKALKSLPKIKNNKEDK